MTKEQKIESLLTRCVSEVVHKDHLAKQLRSGKKLRVKLGIDPTSPNIHIGRAVALWKLRAFQDLGHQVIFLIGDYTARVGDTSDKDSERPMLTDAQIKKNMKDYFKQAFLILDKVKTETHFNSEWLKKLKGIEIIELANLFSLNEFQSRELIKLRVEAGKSVSMREAIYPIMQGYDSVALRADVELGGTDQRFNLLAGRVIQKYYKQEPQDIMMMDLLEGTDGRKMSSSWGNVINLTDAPDAMFGKVMAIDDSLIQKYFVYATNIPEPEIKAFLKATPHPREQKLQLAESITAMYHGAKAAVAAREHFISQFTNKELPADIPTKKIKPGNHQVSKLLVSFGLCSSNSEARRLIEQKGVKLNQQLLEHDGEIIVKPKQKLLIQVGKRKFINLHS